MCRPDTIAILLKLLQHLDKLKIRLLPLDYEVDFAYTRIVISSKCLLVTIDRITGWGNTGGLRPVLLPGWKFSSFCSFGLDLCKQIVYIVFMISSFANKETEKLFTTGKSRKLPPEIITRSIMRLTQL